MKEDKVCGQCGTTIPMGSSECPGCGSRIWTPDAATEERRVASNYAVEFKELGPCIEFLDLALRNKSALRIDRSDLDSIVVSPKLYTILIRGIQKQQADLLRRLARAPGVEGTKGSYEGKVYTINELLESVRLVRSTESAGANGVAVTLFKASEKQFRDWYTQLLDMGCRDIRVGFVQPHERNGGLSHLFMIGQVPRGFCPPGDWAQDRGWGARALVFYRFRMGDNCRFYVEWDYEYPLPYLDRIYDLTSAQSHTVLLCADAPQNDRSWADDESIVAAKPQWLCLREDDVKPLFAMSENALRLEATHVTPKVFLEPRTLPGDAVLELHVKRDSRGAGASVESIESEIAWHQQAIEELVRDHRSSYLLRREQIYLAFVFQQDLRPDPTQGGQAPSLNTSFRRLLEQPYTYLRHLKYGFYEDPASEDRLHGLHVVIDTRPGTYNQVLTQLSDDVFIQRLDWHEWGLPLFVRRGDDLRPRLEDESLVPLVRKLIWEDRSHDEPVLLRTLPSRDRRSGRTRWQALYCKDTKSLTDRDCFRFLNERFCAHLLAFREKIPEDLAQALEQKKAEVKDSMTTLKKQITEAAEEGIAQAENHWSLVNTRITRVERTTSALDTGVTDIENTVENFLDEWSRFFQKILKSNETLMRPGLKALEQYENTHAQMAEKLTDYERGLCEIDLKLESNKKKLTERKSQLDKLDEASKELSEQVREMMGKVADAQKRVQVKAADVRTKGEAELSRTNSELAETREQVANLDRCLKGLQQQRLALEEEKGTLCIREQEVKQWEAESADMESENSQMRERLDQQRNEIKKRMEQLKQRQREDEEEKRRLDEMSKDVDEKVLELVQAIEDSRSRQHQLDQQIGRYRKMEKLVAKASKLLASKLDDTSIRDLEPLSVRRGGRLPSEFLDDIRQTLERRDSERLSRKK